MKTVFLFPVLFLCITAYTNTEQVDQKFLAELPNGATVELIGVSYRSQGLSQPKQWWQPNGMDMAKESYRHSTRTTTGSSGYKVRDFAMCITGVDDYSCVTYNSLGRINVQPVVPVDKDNQFISGVLAFVGKFKGNMLEDTIRVGVSTEPWQIVEDWQYNWSSSEPENIVVNSDNPLIFTWPRREKRGAIIVEITHRYIDEAIRLLMYDIEGNMHEEKDSLHSVGDGLAQHFFWFWGTPLENIRRFEFQKRPFQWVEFRNVSLEPSHKTKIETAVLSVKDKQARDLALNKQEEESLGYILEELADNLRFPESGRVEYQIEECSSLWQNPRVLNCEYIFNGSMYNLYIVGKDPGDLNIKRTFDGEKSLRWEIRNKVVTIQDRREKNPIYNLQQYCPTEIVEELLDHEVEIIGPCEIGDIPCILLDCVMSSKDRLKVWVAKEPGIYPVRIERYEFDNLKYVYESENIKFWNKVLFPKKIKESSYKSDETIQHIPISSYIVTIKSFTPNIEIATNEFTPDFPTGTTVTKSPSKEPEESDFEPTIPAKYLNNFGSIDINFDIEQAADKKILVCFFDMQQRPSRNYIMQLVGQANELKQKDVVVAIIQLSKVDEKELNQWAKEQKIPFPVGVVPTNVEETKATWGVKSLPWLILTDKNHVVAAEGFSVDELDKLLVQEKRP